MAQYSYHEALVPALLPRQTISDSAQNATAQPTFVLRRAASFYAARRI